MTFAAVLSGWRDAYVKNNPLGGGRVAVCKNPPAVDSALDVFAAIAAPAHEIESIPLNFAVCWPMPI